MTLLTPPPYRSDAWQDWRRQGLGASDLAAVVGCDPYKGEYALALEKRGETEPIEETTPMRWGKVIEGLALDFIEQEDGMSIVRGETFGDPRWPHMWATLDGRDGRIGYEVKATTRWTEPPRHVRVQALGQIGLADLDVIRVVRVSPYGEPLVTTIERDDAAITDLLELGEAWYAKYVEGGELPPPDGSREASRYLDRFRGEADAEATADQAAIAGALRQVRLRQDALEAERRALEGALKASMAGTGRLTGDGFHVVWSAVKPRTTTDWKLVAKAYRSMCEQRGIEADPLDSVESIYTATGEGGTRLLVKFEEETE